LVLTSRHRDELDRHLFDLQGLLQQTPAHSQQHEEQVLALMTKIMMVLPAPAQNELSVVARGEAYLMALEDIPAWAVRAAVRGWYRGDCGLSERGTPYDYHWCPAPAELRRVAWARTLPVRERIHILERLVSTEPLNEFDDDHCREMRARTAQLFRRTEIPPVGTDGSGGEVGDEPIDVLTVGRSLGTTRPEA
jgi:hypothetical protein